MKTIVLQSPICHEVAGYFGISPKQVAAGCVEKQYKGRTFFVDRLRISKFCIDVATVDVCVPVAGPIEVDEHVLRQVNKFNCKSPDGAVCFCAPNGVFVKRTVTLVAGLVRPTLDGALKRMHCVAGGLELEPRCDEPAIEGGDADGAASEAEPRHIRVGFGEFEGAAAFDQAAGETR